MTSRRARFNQHRIGLGYIDDCFAISLNYITDYNYSGTTTTDNKVMLVDQSAHDRRDELQPGCQQSSSTQLE